MFDTLAIKMVESLPILANTFVVFVCPTFFVPITPGKGIIAASTTMWTMELWPVNDCYGLDTFAVLILIPFPVFADTFPILVGIALLPPVTCTMAATATTMWAYRVLNTFAIMIYISLPVLTNTFMVFVKPTMLPPLTVAIIITFTTAMWA